VFLARDELDGSASSWPYGYSARANPLAVYDDSDNRVAVVGDKSRHDDRPRVGIGKVRPCASTKPIFRNQAGRPADSNSNHPE
jgi:hypothetical protein